MFCTFFRIKDPFSACIVITALHKALPPTSLFLSSNSRLTSLSPQLSLYLAHFSRAELSDLSPLSLLETSAPCDVQAYTYARPPDLDPCGKAAAPESTIQSYRAPAATLARLQRMTADGGGAPTGGRVQRSGLLPCRVPGVHPFMDIMCSFFFSPLLFCASWVN